jgi:hypothetical protein
MIDSLCKSSATHTCRLDSDVCPSRLACQRMLADPWSCHAWQVSEPVHSGSDPARANIAADTHRLIRSVHSSQLIKVATGVIFILILFELLIVPASVILVVGTLKTVGYAISIGGHGWMIISCVTSNLSNPCSIQIRCLSIDNFIRTVYVKLNTCTELNIWYE